MRSGSILGLAAVSVVAAMGIGQMAMGADAYYTGAAGNPGTTTQWSDPLNWLNGIMPGANDVANFVPPFNGTAALGAPREIGSLYYNPGAECGISGSNAQPLTITTGNFFRGSGSMSVQRFDMPIILGTGSNGSWYSSTGIGFAGVTSFYKPITGDASLTMMGPVNFGGEVMSVFELNNSASFTLNSLKITRAASLTVHPSATVDRFANAMPIEIEDGDMVLSSGSSALTEAIGTFTYSGESYLRLQKSSTGSMTVNAAGLNRLNNGVLTIRSGSSADVMGTDLRFIVAGGVPAPTGMVSPSIVRRMTDDMQGADTNFLNYDLTNGFTDAVNTPRTELDLASAQDTDIVVLTKTATDQPTLSAPLTIQALKFTQGNTDINGTGTLTISSGGIIAMQGDNDIRTPLVLGGEGVVYVTNPSYQTLNLNGAVDGTQGLTKHGMGNLGLNSSANTFTGPVTVIEGQLSIGGNSPTGDGNGLNRAGGVLLPLRVGPAGVVQLNARSQRVGGLDGAGRIMGGNNTTTFTINRDNSVVSDFAGTFTATAMNLVKQGNGTQILSGSNLLTGTTTVEDGILLAKHNKAFGNGTLAATGGVARLQAGTGKALLTKGVSVSGTGQIDVTDSGMIVDYTDPNPLTTVTGYLATGYAAGAWNGTGINSSVAAATPGMTLGVADNAVLGLTSFGGETVDATSILVKYVYSGDLNWDGVVDGVDLSLLGANWQSAGTWAQGDMNYDGAIDGIDLSLLGSNWQAGVAAPLNVSFAEAAGAMGMSVPEPASLAVVGLGTLALGLRRRRHA